MVILDKVIPLSEISELEQDMFFNEDEMVKAVADIDKGILALNAELHSDLEQLLLEFLQNAAGWILFQNQ